MAEDVGGVVSIQVLESSKPESRQMRGGLMGFESRGSSEVRSQMVPDYSRSEKLYASRRDEVFSRESLSPEVIEFESSNIREDHCRVFRRISSAKDGSLHDAHHRTQSQGPSMHADQGRVLYNSPPPSVSRNLQDQFETSGRHISGSSARVSEALADQQKARILRRIGSAKDTHQRSQSYGHWGPPARDSSPFALSPLSGSRTGGKLLEASGSFPITRDAAEKTLELSTEPGRQTEEALAKAHEAGKPSSVNMEPGVDASSKRGTVTPSLLKASSPSDAYQLGTTGLQQRSGSLLPGVNFGNSDAINSIREPNLSSQRYPRHQVTALRSSVSSRGGDGAASPVTSEEASSPERHPSQAVDSHAAHLRSRALKKTHSAPQRARNPQRIGDTAGTEIRSSTWRGMPGAKRAESNLGRSTRNEAHESGSRQPAAEPSWEGAESVTNVKGREQLLASEGGQKERKETQTEGKPWNEGSNAGKLRLDAVELGRSGSPSSLESSPVGTVLERRGRAQMKVVMHNRGARRLSDIAALGKPPLSPSPTGAASERSSSDQLYFLRDLSLGAEYAEGGQSPAQSSSPELTPGRASALSMHSAPVSPLRGIGSFVPSSTGVCLPKSPLGGKSSPLSALGKVASSAAQGSAPSSPLGNKSVPVFSRPSESVPRPLRPERKTSGSSFSKMQTSTAEKKGTGEAEEMKLQGSGDHRCESPSANSSPQAEKSKECGKPNVAPGLKAAEGPRSMGQNVGSMQVMAGGRTPLQRTKSEQLQGLECLNISEAEIDAEASRPHDRKWSVDLSAVAGKETLQREGLEQGVRRSPPRRPLVRTGSESIGDWVIVWKSDAENVKRKGGLRRHGSENLAAKLKAAKWDEIEEPKSDFAHKSNIANQARATKLEGGEQKGAKAMNSADNIKVISGTSQKHKSSSSEWRLGTSEKLNVGSKQRGSSVEAGAMPQASVDQSVKAAEVDDEVGKPFKPSSDRTLRKVRSEKSKALAEGRAFEFPLHLTPPLRRAESGASIIDGLDSDDEGPQGGKAPASMLARAGSASIQWCGPGSGNALNSGDSNASRNNMVQSGVGVLGRNCWNVMRTNSLPAAEECQALDGAVGIGFTAQSQPSVSDSQAKLLQGNIGPTGARQDVGCSVLSPGMICLSNASDKSFTEATVVPLATSNASTMTLLGRLKSPESNSPQLQPVGSADSCRNRADASGIATESVVASIAPSFPSVAHASCPKLTGPSQECSSVNLGNDSGKNPHVKAETVGRRTPSVISATSAFTKTMQQPACGPQAGTSPVKVALTMPKSPSAGAAAHPFCEHTRAIRAGGDGIGPGRQESRMVRSPSAGSSAPPSAGSQCPPPALAQAQACHVGQPVKTQDMSAVAAAKSSSGVVKGMPTPGRKTESSAVPGAASRGDKVKASSDSRQPGGTSVVPSGTSQLEQYSGQRPRTPLVNPSQQQRPRTPLSGSAPPHDTLTSTIPAKGLERPRTPIINAVPPVTLAEVTPLGKSPDRPRTPLAMAAAAANVVPPVSATQPQNFQPQATSKQSERPTTPLRMDMLGSPLPTVKQSPPVGALRSPRRASTPNFQSPSFGAGQGRVAVQRPTTPLRMDLVTSPTSAGPQYFGAEAFHDASVGPLGNRPLERPVTPLRMDILGSPLSSEGRTPGSGRSPSTAVDMHSPGMAAGSPLERPTTPLRMDLLGATIDSKSRLPDPMSSGSSRPAAESAVPRAEKQQRDHSVLPRNEAPTSSLALEQPWQQHSPGFAQVGRKVRDVPGLPKSPSAGNTPVQWGLHSPRGIVNAGTTAAARPLAKDSLGNPLARLKSASVSEGRGSVSGWSQQEAVGGAFSAATSGGKFTSAASHHPAASSVFAVVAEIPAGQVPTGSESSKILSLAPKSTFEARQHLHTADGLKLPRHAPEFTFPHATEGKMGAVAVGRDVPGQDKRALRKAVSTREVHRGQSWGQGFGAVAESSCPQGKDQLAGTPLGPVAGGKGQPQSKLDGLASAPKIRGSAANTIPVLMGNSEVLFVDDESFGGRGLRAPSNSTAPTREKLRPVTSGSLSLAASCRAQKSQGYPEPPAAGVEIGGGDFRKAKDGKARAPQGHLRSVSSVGNMLVIEKPLQLSPPAAGTVKQRDGSCALSAAWQKATAGDLQPQVRQHASIFNLDTDTDEGLRGVELVRNGSNVLVLEGAELEAETAALPLPTCSPAGVLPSETPFKLATGEEEEGMEFISSKSDILVLDPVSAACFTGLALGSAAQHKAKNPNPFQPSRTPDNFTLDGRGQCQPIRFAPDPFQLQGSASHSPIARSVSPLPSEQRGFRPKQLSSPGQGHPSLVEAKSDSDAFLFPQSKSAQGQELGPTKVSSPSQKVKSSTMSGSSGLLGGSSWGPRSKSPLEKLSRGVESAAPRSESPTVGDASPGDPAPQRLRSHLARRSVAAASEAASRKVSSVSLKEPRCTHAFREYMLRRQYRVLEESYEVVSCQGAGEGAGKRSGPQEEAENGGERSPPNRQAGHTVLAETKLGRVVLVRARRSDTKGRVQTGCTYVCKTLFKSAFETADEAYDAVREIDILQELRGHPSIVQMVDALEDAKSIHIIMELCRGGDLFDFLRCHRTGVSERDAAAVCKSLMGALQHCHSRGILHRDVKPENLLLASKDNLDNAKLIDFGVACKFDGVGVQTSQLFGTPLYLSPEALDGYYSPASDIWSAGVVVYALLCGAPPFWAASTAAVYAAIRKKDPGFSSPRWLGVSEDAKSLLRRMLEKDAKKRATAAEVLAHRWIRSFEGRGGTGGFSN